ncbi:P-loop containing nucleoside triphosphate hydrolase [Pseudocohnilembus persalinus]|uniref:p-loop containing nucleoside triphosphate hydrolase n=1 Tax=Pseudocohnilembus persalinus TaxID=266149 RepID=A0A0V0QLS9_PSEPJ|nr:P-loop containing nucleoside triphosphate hydrolase [Pseudocohnilembus persalinus]|eukprot:KRX03211.1 P-loop containing nucleoside triphosphate hydrolase [Pseudocohnilembus persalinus]
MIPEPVNIWTNYKGHNYLELFYKDTQKYAFAFQLMVMNTALNAYVEGQKEHAGKLRFFERSLYSPIKTFALKQYNDGVITQPEYDLQVLKWLNLELLKEVEKKTKLFPLNI